MVTLTLMWLAQNYMERGWPVRYSVEASFFVGETLSASAFDGQTAEAELLALAAARGAATWDESDVITHFSNTHGGGAAVAVEVRPVDQPAARTLETREAER